MSHGARQQAELHVVLGSGQVGPRLAEILYDRGHRVRIVRRRPPGPARFQWAQADLTDVAAATAACAGASVIYDCTNPSGYGSWDETLAPLRRGVMEAAARNGAFLVSLDNLYAYGRPDGGTLTEDTPLRPCSAKGELRARLVRELLEAVGRGHLRATVARASDFFGPGASTMSLYGDRFVRGLARGKPAIVLGRPDLPRSYSYVPDVAAGMAALGERPTAANGGAFHLPVSWKTGTTRELVQQFAVELGVAPRTRRLPRWLFRAMGPFSRDLAAVAEMIYQWETPYIVDDTRFVTAFKLAATPAEVAIRESVEAAGFTPRGAEVKTRRAS